MLCRASGAEANYYALYKSLRQGGSHRDVPMKKIATYHGSCALAFQRFKLLLERCLALADEELNGRADGEEAGNQSTDATELDARASRYVDCVASNLSVERVQGHPSWAV